MKIELQRQNVVLFWAAWEECSVCFFFSLILRLGHHHLTELVEVHRAGAVLVELFKDSFDLLVSEGSQQLSDQTPQGICGDETLTLAIV